MGVELSDSEVNSGRISGGKAESEIELARFINKLPALIVEA
jgi:hypothetical protein